jgi:parallel beta-helix repeat protein
MEGGGRVARHALALLVLLLLILAGARFSAPARAATSCPGVITQDTTLQDDIVAQVGGPTECIRFGVGGITLNLNGKTVDIRPLHMSGRAFAVDGVSDVTINGPGTAITTYDNASLSPRAVRVRDTSNLTIHDVRVLNLDANGHLLPIGKRVGRAMDLEYVTGGNITGNEAAGFGRGIYFLDSNGTSGFDQVDSNYVHDNAIDIARSFGIGLLGSSGWSITNNTSKRNGSLVNGEAGIEIQTGSNDNVVSGNRATHNLGPGITADSDTSGNVFELNVARNNGQAGVGPDVADANPAPSPNTWNPNNRCDYEGGSVPAGVCNPGEQSS